MSDGIPATTPSDGSPTERIERAQFDAWQKRVNERLDTNELRLTKVDELLVEIKVHLAKIDTNVAWFVKTLKWIGGLGAPGGILYKIFSE